MSNLVASIEKLKQEGYDFGLKDGYHLGSKEGIKEAVKSLLSLKWNVLYPNSDKKLFYMESTIT